MNRFIDGLSNLKEKRLEIITNKSLLSRNAIKTKNKYDIFKTTEVFPTIKIGCKYDPDDKNTLEEEEQIEFSDKLKDMINKISKSKNKSRNIKNKNCYDILDELKRKKKYNCKKLIQKTSEEVKDYKNQIINVYTSLRKNFEEGDEWQNLDNFYNVS